MNRIIISPVIWSLLLQATLSGCQEKVQASQNLVETQTTEKEHLAKINGVCFVAPAKAITTTEMGCVDSVSANWVCLMPYAFTPKNEAKVLWNHKWQWWGEKREGFIETIKLAQQLNKKIMVKPHLWIGHGEFTGNLKFDTEQKWSSWERDYAKYVLDCAHIADSLKAEIFCFGTELKTPINERTAFWLELIDSIRVRFSGKITYAANWDNFEQIPFWNKLDFIGVDAYFPLTSKINPSKEELAESWKPWSQKLQNLSKKHDRKILFTEFGYRSIQNNLEAPYEYAKSAEYHLEAQSVALNALFTHTWNQDWMAGGFLWKWYANHQKQHFANNDYSPQNKPAQQIIRQYYSTH
ncbi:MAG: hypothetical protein KDC92_09215 [Bacteroidetes bacterium]|nr:hypothetical protein [Bacteroidota bacterium]